MSLLQKVFEGEGSKCRSHFMVQPFVSTVLTEGEFSVFLMRGVVSHATQKQPRVGDFRVQEEFGGQQILRDYHTECPHQLREAVDHLLSSFPQARDLLCARVDMLRDPFTEGPRYLLAEFEAIEPSMYFEYAPGSADRFAAAFDCAMREHAQQQR